MIIVIFWLILAILVGVFAGSKGRTGVGLFFLSLLFSPLIGFIIALVVSPKTKVTEANALKSGEMKKCPNCAELVKTEAKICKHCSNDIGTQAIIQ